MVDIHSHILWGLDDGAKTLEESLAMLRVAAQTGTRDIVATPHSNHRYPYDSAVVAERIAELTKMAADGPRIHRGCDFHISPENLDECAENPAKFTINGLGFLLVEFSDMAIPLGTEGIFRGLMAHEIIPVITHPERNPILRESTSRLSQWVDMGCLLQVTAQSLTSRFGGPARRAGWKLLREGLVHVLASDGHDVEYRPPRLDLARDIVARELGADVADLLLIGNPSAIIAGRKGDTEPATPTRVKKSWFGFGR